MSIMSRLMARAAKLPSVESRQIAVEKNLQIPMPDGVTLLADHFYPRDLGARPTVLTRSVYSERVNAPYLAEMIAEQGFHVLVVSGRGTFGSDGVLDPFRQEHDDGVAVLEWLEQQSWFNGSLGMFGTSYSAYTQWAIAKDANRYLKAISPQLINSDARFFMMPGGGFALELFMFWVAMVHSQERSLLEHLWNISVGNQQRQKLIPYLPLGKWDEAALGKIYPFWRDWLSHDRPTDSYWDKGNHHKTVEEVDAPLHLYSGWYDFALPGLIKDYLAVRAAGKSPYLTVGPWSHFDSEASFTGMRSAVLWLRAHLLEEQGHLQEKPVRIYVMGAKEWREYADFPPPGTAPQVWHLHPERGLSTLPATDSTPDRYTYNPADPTPSIGGARPSGKPRQDQKALESRPDVLTYTGTPLEQDTEVIGAVSAELYVRSSLENIDFFVCLCDVDLKGVSTNVCDGLLRLFAHHPPTDGEGVRHIIVELAPTAYRFKQGHRLRVQVASGSFPRWNRNLGTGEPALTATEMRVAEQEIFHDEAHPSALFLPMVKTW